MLNVTCSTVRNASPCFEAVHCTIPRDPDDSEADRQDALQSSDKAAHEGYNPSQDPDKKSKTSHNPLHWFGVLVAPALRASQSNFQFAVMEDVPALASLAKEVRELEIEVRRARKKLNKAH